MKAILLKFVATRLAAIGGSDFDRVVGWVIDVSTAKLEGWQKAQEVISLFNGKWGMVAGFIARTVVQLAYTYARLKGFIPDKKS